MKKWVSRIALEITNIRVERIRKLSEYDAIAEGVEKCIKHEHEAVGHCCQFERLWDSINKKRGFGWDTDPWVWVIEFRRLETDER
jgi:hypothetical protein